MFETYPQVSHTQCKSGSENNQNGTISLHTHFAF